MLRSARAVTVRSEEGAAPAPATLGGVEPGSTLGALAEIASELGADEIVRGIQELAARVAEGRFHLACVGQFKRGKSTLLNALVGDPVLPTGVVPVTAVVTVLRHGPRRSARVRLASEGWRAVDPAALADYVTESGNPGNAKRVEAVEVSLPSPLLEHGMSLVDTPGIGSVYESGSLATRRFVPHIDAALVVLGADPPISGGELDLVREVARDIRQLIFVLNKADRLPESDRGEALGFTRRILEENLQRPIEAIHEISATEVLAGRALDWDWRSLVDRLTSLAREGGAELVRGAEARGRANLAARLGREIAERRGALLRPLEESERRIEALRRSVEDAERSLQDLAYLWQGEQDRMAARLRSRQQEFVDSALPAAIEEFRTELARLDERRRDRLRGRALELLRALSRGWLERWRSEQEPAAEAEYREAAGRFVALGNEFVSRLKRAGLEGSLSELPPESGFRTRSRLYYTDLSEHAPVSAAAWILDRLRARSATRRAVERAAEAYLEELLVTNASRVTNEAIDRAVESRRRLEGELRSQIRSLFGMAERALARARATQVEGSRAVEAEVARLAALERRLAGMNEPEEERDGP